jgi:hypothetical protein
MNEEIQKELEKNYSKVQKQEIKVSEGAQKFLDKYDKTIGDLGKTLKSQAKDQKDADKKIKDDHKAALKGLKDAHKEDVKTLETNMKEVEKTYSNELEKAESDNNKEVAKLNTQIEKAQSNFEKQKEKLQKQYDKDVEASQKEIEKINTKAAKSLESAEAKLQERKVKYDEKVTSLNEKRDAAILKLNERSEKDIEKLNKTLETQRAKTDKQIAGLEPIYTSKMAELQKIIDSETEDFNTKTTNIKETLESKVTRRNKFLEKAENEKDAKAAKQQRKEIKQLEQIADKDLKALHKAYDDRMKDLDSKIKELNKNNLEQAAAIEREFVNFKEDILLQIELNKATLADEITKAKLDTDLKLLDELSKFDEFVAENTDEVSEIVKEQELALAEQTDIQAKLAIEFEKDNALNEFELETELASRNKEIKISNINKDSSESLSENVKEVELRKLEAQKEIRDHQFVQDEKLNDEDALIAYHEVDLEKLNSVKSEFLEAQNATQKLFEERASEILKYEELELENRVKLKVKFLNEQLKRLDKDYNNLVAVIENAFAQEKNLYEIRIGEIAEEDRKEFAKFKDEKEKEIAELTKEKADLDPENKARLKEVLGLIESNKQAIVAEEQRVEEGVKGETKLFQDQIQLAVARKDKALAEAKEFYQFEVRDITYAIELLEQNKEAEIKEAQARYAKTLQNNNNYVNLATTRNAKTTEEFNQYLATRVDAERKAIEIAKNNFEGLREDINNRLNDELKDLDGLKQQIVARIKSESLAEEKALEDQLAAINQKISAAENTAKTKLQEQLQSHMKQVKDIEVKYNVAVKEAADLLKSKMDKYKAEVAEIDKKQTLENKNFESEKNRVQKEYEVELKKGIAQINTKLDADIKAL